MLPFDDPFRIRELGEIVRHQRSQLWTRVAEQDRGFDQIVETILRKGQRKQSREWKEKLARGPAEQGRLESAPSPG